MVRCQNRNFQQAGIFSPDSKTPEDQNMRAFFFQSDKARVRSTVTDFPCPQDLFVHCFVCKFRDIRPLGITVLLLVGRLKGVTFSLVRKKSSVSQQGSLLDQGCLLLHMCSFSVSGLGITWGCLLHISFPVSIFPSYLSTCMTTDENFSVRNTGSIVLENMFLKMENGLMQVEKLGMSVSPSSSSDTFVTSG